jgi:hypothetical protein
MNYRSSDKEGLMDVYQPLYMDVYQPLYLFRIENPDSQKGLWYDSNGNYSGVITTIGDAKSADLPMEFDEDFGRDGNWHSACQSMEVMRDWFTKNDLQKLSALGYKLFQLQVPSYKVLNGHAVFLKNAVLKSDQLKMEDLE